MSVTNLLAVTDEAFISKTLTMLEAQVTFDIPHVSAGDFESVLEAVRLHSLRRASIDAYSPSESSTNESGSNRQSRIREKLVRVAMKSRRYRNRKREELESLRSTMKTLEVRLAALKARPVQYAAPREAFPRKWKEVAMHESERRQVAERENDELRKAVAMHVHLAQKLDHVIKKVVARVGTTPNGLF